MDNWVRSTISGFLCGLTFGFEGVETSHKDRPLGFEEGLVVGQTYRERMKWFQEEDEVGLTPEALGRFLKGMAASFTVSHLVERGVAFSEEDQTLIDQVTETAEAIELEIEKRRMIAEFELE